MTALRLSHGRRRHTHLLAAAAFLLALPGTAGAASGTTDCAGLQAALDQTQTGDVITLNESCNEANSGDAHGSFTLKEGVAITLQGTSNTGFDGAGAPTRILTGHSVGGTTIANLSFRNGRAPSGGSGGAILIDGNSAPVFQNASFFANAADALGGAVALLTPGATSGTVVFANSVVGSRSGDGNGNQATIGGGIYVQTPRRVEIRGNLFAANAASDTGGAVAFSGGDEILFGSNLVEGNTAQAGGGGVQLCCNRLVIASNAFRSNSVADPNANFGSHRGGGLLASSSIGGGTGQIVQSGNVFDSNVISFSGSAASASGGAAEYAIGGNLTSRNDLFVTNALQGASAGGESRGAGVRIDCNGAELTALFENAVIAGNVLGAGGFGAGISGACGSGIDHLNLYNATVAGNSTADGAAAAIDGGGADTLGLANAIVSPPGGSPAVSGFGVRGVSFTDVCDPGAPTLPFPGEGNICADPLLLNPGPGVGNYHETAGSPTIDAGSNTLLAGDLGVDAEGNARVTDGNGDGNEVVDMGADESPAVPLIPIQKPLPPVGTGPDVPGPPPPVVVVTTKPNKPQRVVYVRVIITRHHGRYLLTRITGRGRARIRLRLLDGKHRSQSVTRTVRTNRAVTVKNVPLVGVRLIRVSVLS